MPCPLCSSLSVDTYYSDQKRNYFQCNICDLVFVDPCQLPAPEIEKREYDLHQNSADDNNYRRFLQKLASPMLEKLKQKSYGLDFGCGPTPLMSLIFKEAGHHCEAYDPFYFSNREILNNRYDFLTCSEVVEHFHHPEAMFSLLSGALVPSGWLGIMTKRVIDVTRFSTWHYKNDPTHVSFYSEQTFHFIAKKYAFTLYIVSSDVVLLQKQ